jgi:hypothetical protein
MNDAASRVRETAAAVAALGPTAAHIAELSDPALLAAQSTVSEHRRNLDTYASWIAGEIAKRSHRDLGSNGLAQRHGFLNAVGLVQSLSQATRSEATKFVNIGQLIAASSPLTPDVDEPLDSASRVPATGRAIAHALLAGSVSSDAADAVRRGLGEAGDGVAAAELEAAAQRLLTENAGRDADQLARLARRMRDEIDELGIARREKERRDLRYFTISRRSDGMYRGSFLLDPEHGQLVASAFDEILSPRRGGPRFVSPTARARARTLLDDERTNEQISADALFDIVQLAVDSDKGTVFGTRRPAVRVIVTESDLKRNPDGSRRRRGSHGQIEGQVDAVSIETIERYLCDAGTITVGMDDDGQCVNVGREKRLFTARQRIGLAVRDGGCRFPSCDRPPAWCEAHHVKHWQRDHGETNIADGILLCRRHHLLSHNNHWEIERYGGEYWLQPPVSIDPKQSLIEMPRKQPMTAAPITNDSRHERTG